MSPNDGYDSRRRRPLYGAATRRSTLGYWVPLIVTVTIATAGLAAWIWSERQDGDDDDDDDENINHDNEYTTDEYDKPDLATRRPSDGRETTFDSPPPSYPGSASRSAAAAAGAAREDEEEEDVDDDESFFGRVSGVMRRTPSPQHFFDNAGQRLAAGVAAAGAAVGLGSIVEERTARGGGGGGFSDHERWSEEAETMRIEAQSGKKATSSAAAQSARPNPSRRTVAIVVSAESDSESSPHDDKDEENDDDDVEYRTEHASILSHLPQHFDPSTTRLFVLIYAPHLTSLPSQSSPSRRPASLSSSYSALATPSPPPGEEKEGERLPKPRLFNALWTQSLALVDKDSMILPFTTPTGYLHLLRHLAPSLVYVSDKPALSGPGGENIAQLKGWVGQTVVVVGDHGDGGLADTDTEDENAATAARGSTRHGGGHVWWDGSELVGLGKGVEIVDAGHVGDDWVRRVGGRP